MPRSSPISRKHPGDSVVDVMNALKSADEGEYLIGGHLAYNDAEIQNLGHPVTQAHLLCIILIGNGSRMLIRAS